MALVVAVLLALPLLVSAQAQPDRHACRNRPGVVGDDTWTIVPVPAFATGEAQPRRHASHPRRPAVHYVTNGTAIQRTQDGGCTWTEVYALPASRGLDQPFSAETGRIVDIGLPGDTPNASRVYVVVLDLAQGGLTELTDPPTVAHILRSDQNGDPGTYRKVDQGLTPIGRAGGGDITGCGPLSGCLFEVSPNDADVLFLALSPDPNGPGSLQRSADGGVTWTSVNVPVGDEPVQGIEQLEVNPARAGDVYIDHGGLFRSPDGGASWLRQRDGLNGLRAGLDLAADASGLRVLTVSVSERSLPGPISGVSVLPAGANAYSTVDLGSLDLHGATAESVAHGASAADIVLNGGRTVFAYQPRDGVFVDIDPRGHAQTFGPFRNLQTVYGGEFGIAFTALGTGVLAIYHGPTGEALAEDPPPLAIPPLDTPPAPETRPATIEPAGAVVEVEPDTTEALDVTLDLPAPPRKVDVFFLMDTSTSMEKTVDGLAAGLSEIARRVAQAGVDAHFGLAEFQDSDSHARGQRYRRRVDVSPPDPRLQSELQRIRTIGGNEPHLTAMHQMATGAGLLQPSAGRGVEPGQGATWRDGSIRVAVMITNEPYGRDASPGTTDATDSNRPDPDGPSYGTVLRELERDATRVVGVRIVLPEEEIGLGDSLTGANEKRQENEANAAIAAATLKDLQQWARDTDAVAPIGGIDCDADGNIDVVAGEPLVCSVFEQESSRVNEMTHPLVRLILSLADVAPVQLQATVDARIVPPGVTVEATPRGDYGSVNLGADQRLGFGLTVGCTEEEAGQVFPIRLEALVEGRSVATSPMSLVCGQLPVEDVPAPEPPAPRVVPPPAPPAPPPAPINAPVPAGAPAPAAASAGVTVAAPAAAPGLAPPPAVFDGGPAEVQVRLANEARGRRGQLMLASGRREPAVSPIVLTLLGAVVLTGLATSVAVGDRKRRRLALAGRPWTGERRRRPQRRR